MPILRIELEGMRRTLLTAITRQNGEVEVAVGEALAKFVETYDFAAEIQRQMQPVLEAAIKRSIEQHFTYGPGAALLQIALTKALAHATGTKEP